VNGALRQGVLQSAPARGAVVPGNVVEVGFRIITSVIVPQVTNPVPKDAVVNEVIVVSEVIKVGTVNEKVTVLFGTPTIELKSPE